MFRYFERRQSIGEIKHQVLHRRFFSSWVGCNVATLQHCNFQKTNKGYSKVQQRKFKSTTKEIQCCNVKSEELHWDVGQRERKGKLWNSAWTRLSREQFDRTLHWDTREDHTPGKTLIHPKRWCPRCQDSADNFEFSAERLSENAKSIKITLFAELLTVIFPIYVQSLK